MTEMKKGQWPTAIKLLKRNLAAAQKNWRCSGIGWCHFSLGDSADAQKYMMQAVTARSREPNLQVELGRVSISREGTFKKGGSRPFQNRSPSKTRTQLASPWPRLTFHNEEVAEAEKDSPRRNSS